MHKQDAIQVRNAHETIRRRPSMYVGSCDSGGIKYLAAAIADDAIGEAVSGFATFLKVTKHQDGSLEFEDNGRPLPTVAVNELGDQSVAEFCFTVLHTDVAPSIRGDRPWSVGVGGGHFSCMASVNALCEWVTVETGNGSTVSILRMSRGVIQGTWQHCSGAWKGCRIRIKPDPLIFQSSELTGDELRHWLRELASLHSGLRIEFLDTSSGGLPEVYEFPDGVAGYVKWLNRSCVPLYAPVVTASLSTEIFRMDTAFQHVRDRDLLALAFVNAVETIEGGTHWIGFQSGVTRAVNQCLKDRGCASRLRNEDIFRGMTAVVSIWVDDPAFEGPTRTRFQYSAIRGTVESKVYLCVKEFLNASPDVLSAVLHRSEKGDV